MNDIDQTLLERIREKTLLIRQAEDRLADLTYEAGTLRRALRELRADREKLLGEQASPAPMPLFDQVDHPETGDSSWTAKPATEAETAPIPDRPVSSATAAEPSAIAAEKPANQASPTATPARKRSASKKTIAAKSELVTPDDDRAEEQPPAALTDGPFHLECTRCSSKRPPFAELKVNACPSCQNPEFAVRPGAYSGPRWWDVRYVSRIHYAVTPTSTKGDKLQEKPVYFMRADSFEQARAHVLRNHPAGYTFALEVVDGSSLTDRDYVVDARKLEAIPSTALDIPSTALDIPSEPAAMPDPLESLLGSICDYHPLDPLTPVLNLALSELPKVTIARMRSEGATDGVIKGQLLAGHWGDGPSHDVPRKAVMGGYWTQGGTRPALWTADPNDVRDEKVYHKRAAAKHRRPDLEGKELLARVRVLLRIPKPGQTWVGPDRPAPSGPPATVIEPTPSADSPRDEIEDDDDDDQVEAEGQPGGGYSPSHPWYYKLGGLPVPPEEISLGANLEDLSLIREPKVERWGIRKRIEHYRRKYDEAERSLGEAIEEYREFIADAENLADLAAAVDRGRLKPSSEPIHDAYSSQYNSVCYWKSQIERYSLLLEQLQAEAGEDATPEPTVAGPTPEQREAMLRDALRCDEREHRVDWTLLVANGTSDADLRRKVVAAFGPTHELRSGHTEVTDCGAMSWTVRGGRHPAIWFGWHIAMDGESDMPAPDLQSWPLVQEVRRMLAIPTPEAVAGRQALVAELDAEGEVAAKRLTSRPAKKSDSEAHAELVKKRRAKRTAAATQETMS